MPCFRTPADRLSLAIAVQTMLPSARLTASAPHYRTIEAQSRGLQTPWIRFAARVTPVPRNPRFRLVANLCRMGTFHPTGSHLEVSMASILLRHIPSHQALPGAITLSVRFHCFRPCPKCSRKLSLASPKKISSIFSSSFLMLIPIALDSRASISATI